MVRIKTETFKKVVEDVKLPEQGAWSVDHLQKFSCIEKKKVGKIVAMVSINVKTDSTKEK